MIVVRLKRVLYKEKLCYHIVVSINKRAPISNKHIEKLGSFNTFVDKWSNKFISIDMDRLFFWLTRGMKVNRSIVLLVRPLLFYRSIVSFNFN